MRKTNDTEGRKLRIFLTVAVLALMAGVAVFATSAAFTATTSNPGNVIQAGTVSIGDSDAGTGTLYNTPNQKPGSGNGPTAACLRVTYSGSLASAVQLYRGAVTNGSQFRLKVERGDSLSAPASDMNCNGFNSTSTSASTARPAVVPGAAVTVWTTGSPSTRSTTPRRTLTRRR